MRMTMLSLLKLALACGACAGLVAGCSSPSGDSGSMTPSPQSTSSSSQDASHKAATKADVATAEEAIKADVDELMKKHFDSSVLLAGISNNTQIIELQNSGFDADSYLQTIVNHVTAETGPITVDGNTATATVTVTYPRFDDEARQFFRQKMMEVPPPDNIDEYTTEQVVDLVNQTVERVLSDPAYPTRTTPVKLSYKKFTDGWKVTDDSPIKTVANEFFTATPSDG